MDLPSRQSVVRPTRPNYLRNKSFKLISKLGTYLRFTFMTSPESIRRLSRQGTWKSQQGTRSKPLRQRGDHRHRTG